MANRPSPSLIDHEDAQAQLPQQPLQPNNPSNHLVPPFTPRSSSFPDSLESDDQSDVFEPTPLHSPGGPHYDDLPPTYEEAQHEALQQARAGIDSLDPNNLQIRRLELNSDGTYPHPPSTEGERGTQSNSNLLQDPSAYEFEPENRRNANGLGTMVPVTAVPSSEEIPVYHSNSSAPNPTAELLSRALSFTKHEPDTDARFAPKLTRKIAIPQLSASGHENHPHHHGRHGRGGRRGRGREGPPAPFPPWGRRARFERRMPGQWPSGEDLAEHELGSADEHVDFLRAYAKALHTHSIRPAEFAEFIDGLNAICLATNTSANDLLSSPEHTGDEGVKLVRNYINSANEAFFAPRGLRVGFRSLSALLSALDVPSQSTQKAVALKTILDPKTTPEQKAQSLHPFIERLETDLPGPSAQAEAFREMAERVASHSSSPVSEHHEQAGSLSSDRSASAPNFPPFGTGRGFPPWASRGGCGPGGHRGHPFGHPGRGGPFGQRGAPPMPSFPGFQSRGGPSNSWQAWGEAFGKSMGAWGEDLGKRAEAWGNDFGKRAEAWGEDVGKRAEEFGRGIERRATGREGSWAGGEASSSHSNIYGGGEKERASPFETPGQESGVLRDEDPHPKTKAEEDDDDTSSISSLSSSSSSDSSFEDPSERYSKRLHDINSKAAAASSKGKKPAEEISREREAAIAKAEADKQKDEAKLQKYVRKREMKRELKKQKKELKKMYKGRKRELKREGKGMKSEEGRKLRRERREERRDARGAWKEAKRERKRGTEGGQSGEEEMVWLVVENLGD